MPARARKLGSVGVSGHHQPKERDTRSCKCECLLGLGSCLEAGYGAWKLPRSWSGGMGRRHHAPARGVGGARQGHASVLARRGSEAAQKLGVSSCRCPPEGDSGWSMANPWRGGGVRYLPVLHCHGNVSVAGEVSSCTCPPEGQDMCDEITQNSDLVCEVRRVSFVIRPVCSPTMPHS